jgi:hypothetical protein
MDDVSGTLGRLEVKLDGVSSQVGLLQVSAATDRATLTARVDALEKAADKKWQLVPTWIASIVALALAAAPYVIR